MDRVRTPRSTLAHLASHGTPPDRQTAHHISVGLEKTLARFEDEVFPYLSAGGTEIQFVYGANGRGKTHYLFAVEEIARRKGFVTAKIDCPVGMSPFGSLRGTYEVVAAALQPPPQADADGTSGVPAIVRFALSGANRYSPLEVIARVKGSRQLAPEYRNLTAAYARGLSNGTMSERVREDLESLLVGSPSRLVTIRSLYSADQSLPRPLGKITSRNAASWLRSLLSLPAALGYSGVLITFDETERAFHRLSPAALQEQLAHLRNIVDYCALGAFTGCLIMYAASEDFIDLARKHLDALAQRIEPPTLLPATFPSSIRSAWCDLDDLTSPQTSESEFFNILAGRIVLLGIEAGLSEANADRLRPRLAKDAGKYASSPTSAIVREFVKETAAAVLMEIR